MAVRLFILVCFILLQSCVKSNRDNKKSANDFKLSTAIELDNLTEEGVSASSIFDENITMVPLESTEQGMIANVMDILSINNHFVVYENVKNTLLIFKNTGQYVSKIFPKGRGPMEISQISDFTINLAKNSIDVYDFSLRKIVRFDMHGAPIEEIVFPYSVREFACDAEANYILYSPDLINNWKSSQIPAGLFLVDGKGNFVQTLITFEETPDYYVQPIRCLSGFGKEIGFVSNYKNAYFEVVDGKVNNVFQLNTQLSWISSFTMVNQTTDLITILYSDENGRNRYALVGKNAEFQKTFSGIYNDISLVPLPFPMYHIGDGRNISVVSVAYLKNFFEHFEKEKLSLEDYTSSVKQNFVELKNRIQDMEIDDNPVLFITEFKSNN